MTAQRDAKGTTSTGYSGTAVTSKAVANMKASAENADAARAWERWVDARPNVMQVPTNIFNASCTLNRTEGASLQARRRIMNDVFS
jgi:hypothetical protein